MPRRSVSVRWQHEQATIVRLKITLDDVKPAVLRRVEVPVDITLDRLHLTIQAAMGWTNSHLYDLRFGDVSWSRPYPEADWEGDFLDARKVRLGDILEDIGRKKLTYLYDFGDGWEHSIKVERRSDPEAGMLYPRLIEVGGRCPPDDCGGPWGYADLLEAIRTPLTNATPTPGMDRRGLRSRSGRFREARHRRRPPCQGLVSKAGRPAHKPAAEVNRCRAEAQAQPACAGCRMGRAKPARPSYMEPLFDRGIP